MDPVARAMGTAVSPNIVTVVGLAVGLASAAMAFRAQYGLALVLFLTNRMLDGLDGSLARVLGRRTDFGAYADILADFIVYAAIPGALVFGLSEDMRPSGALFVLIATYYVNAASWMYLSAILERRGSGALARNEQTSVAMPEGLVGGTETIVVYALMLLLPMHLRNLMLVMSALVAITIAQRFLWAFRNLRLGQEQE